jgi:hypothetical protein
LKVLRKRARAISLFLCPALAREAHEAVDSAVEVRVKRFRRAVADVFIGPELATPSATRQLYRGVCPIPLSIGVQRDFSEARFIAGVLAQFVAEPCEGFYQTLDRRRAAGVFWPKVIGF